MEISENSEIDFKLFDLLKQGDEIAFEKIYKLYWLQLYNSAYKRLPEKEICKDLIQNVFTDLWNRRLSIDFRNPTGYLHTAVRFQVLKHLSKNAKQEPFLQHFENSLISPLQADGGILDEEAKNILEHFILALPKKRREIFLLHYFEGLKTASIAIQLKVSQKTVQNQLTTVSQALRFKLTHILALSIYIWLTL